MDSALLESITALIGEGVFTWTDLASGTDYSKTAISRWKSGTYHSAELEAAVRSYAERMAAATAPVALSFHDSLRLPKILALLDDADDRQSLTAAIARFSAPA